jgi:hypothetical protein
MAYMLLIVEPTEQRDARTEAEGRELFGQMVAFSERLKSRGKLQMVESLSSQAKGARVQVRNGKSAVLDGPFAETKEMVGGIYLLNCDSRDEALAIAAECPAAQWCTVEVRETAPCYM